VQSVGYKHAVYLSVTQEMYNVTTKINSSYTLLLYHASVVIISTCHCCVSPAIQTVSSDNVKTNL